MLNWIRSYISDRFQYVEINDVKSLKSRADKRVYNGFFLGQNLIIQYINDTSKLFSLKLVHCANDITAYIIATDLSVLTDIIIFELQKVGE